MDKLPWIALGVVLTLFGGWLVLLVDEWWPKRPRWME
jgi:hypothetical protein